MLCNSAFPFPTVNIFRILFFCLIVNCIHSRLNAQTFYKPRWDKDRFAFKTAIIQKLNSQVKQIGEKIYKDCKVSFSGFDGNIENITIDLPDIFYLKDGMVTEFKFENKLSTSSVTYFIQAEEKTASVTLYLSMVEENPLRIVIVFFKDLKKTTPPQTYILTEIKE